MTHPHQIFEYEGHKVYAMKYSMDVTIVYVMKNNEKTNEDWKMVDFELNPLRDTHEYVPWENTWFISTSRAHTLMYREFPILVFKPKAAHEVVSLAQEESMDLSCVLQPHTAKSNGHFFHTC